MTVTMSIRYSVSDAEVATFEARRAKGIWTNAGARDFRSHQFFTGIYNGQWLFQIDFDDLAHMQKCRDAVQANPHIKTLHANNAKAGNEQVGREILFGLDI